MASSNPSWSLLPLELVENILYRIPVASLVQLKSTCKQWLALLNDKIFIYKHLDLSPKEFIHVTDHNSYQVINLETLSLSSLQGPSKIGSMIHCNGLFLCSHGMRYSQGGIRKLAVWNPFLGQIKWIKPSSSYTWFDIYGFGYDNVSQLQLQGLGFKSEKGCEEVEIYEFKSQLWRSVDYSSAYSWCEWKNQAMSMNGNMYWLAERENGNSKTYFIQCFDFSKEVFKETCCVPFINPRDRYRLSPRLSCFGGDRLSLLARQYSFGDIKVWVTNNIVTDHEEKDDQDVIATVYEIGEGEVKKQVETGRHGWRDRLDVFKISYAFVPSLVPVPK
ncbi:hypothetical protein N665_0002s0113 [Sinapis alba]|nr:hypothetical protein N665_0002s0113 [Sinapis alba]